jgi:hypothetical protein
MSPLARRIASIALLVLGLQFWVLTDATLRPWHLYVLGVALVLACLPWAPGQIFRGIQRVRRVTGRTRAITTAAVFVVAFAYLTFTAHRQHRVLYPKYHDNQSYAVEAQIIASGHLWLPKHEYPDFFDTFHVLVEPVYASMYFPGAAMVFALGVIAHLPWWAMPILVASGCVAMLYRVIAEVIDGFAGLLAALWLMALIWFRHLSSMLMSHPVVLLLGLAAVWAYLRWRREMRLRWALLIGVFCGFAAITRPADALCYAAPIGLCILLDLRRATAPFARLMKTSGVIVAGAAPFLLVQLIFNVGVSGSPFTSPYRIYLDRDAPQLSFGFHTFDPNQRPQSKLPQKQIYHLTYNVDLIDLHRPELLFKTWFDPVYGRLALILDATTPVLLLTPLITVGLLGIGTRPRCALFLVFPLYCLIYLFYAALLRHYTPVVAPAIILLGLLGARQVESLWPGLRARFATFCTAAIIGMCFIVMPEMNRFQEDDPFPYPEITDARENIPASVKRPALVFVKFTPIQGQNVHAEPVYNWEAARIDDNPIIFAHNLGPRNIELVRYYAEHQPDRHVYYYDRLTRTVTPAGLVVDELKRLESLPPATAAATTRDATSTTTAP